MKNSQVVWAEDETGTDIFKYIASLLKNDKFYARSVKGVHREYADRSTADNSHFERACQYSVVIEIFGGGMLLR